MIQVQNLTKYFDGFQALDHADMHVRKGWLEYGKGIHSGYHPA